MCPWREVIIIILTYVSMYVDGRIRRLSSNSNTAQYAAMEDLIQISGPLTEDAIIRVLQARFYRRQYYVSSMSVRSSVNTDKTELCE